MARRKQSLRAAESRAIQKKAEEQAAAAKAAQRMPKTTFKRPQRPNSSGPDEHPAKRAKISGSDPAASKVEEIEQGSGMMKDLSKLVEGYTKVDLVAAALGENDQAFEEYMKRDNAPELELDNNCENTKFAQGMLIPRAVCLSLFEESKTPDLWLVVMSASCVCCRSTRTHRYHQIYSY